MQGHDHPPRSLTIHGLLDRQDRSTLAFIIAIIAISAGFQFTLPSWPAVGFIGIAAFILVRHALTRGRCWAEVVTLTLSADRVDLRRADGHHVSTAWRAFDEARLKQLTSRGSDAMGRWRLTLVNAMKPSIGAFLHSRASDQTVFQFPLVIEFEAETDEAEAIHEFAAACIDQRQEVKRLPPRPRPPAPDPSFALESCVQCGYALTGLPEASRCPECGWQYQAGMFVLNGESKRDVKSIYLSAGFFMIWVAGAMMTRTAGGYLLFALAMAGAAIWLTYWWKTSASTARFRPVILITADGVQVWRGGHRLRTLDWNEIVVLQSAVLDSGRVRIAMWDCRVWRVKFRRLFETWRTIPPSRPPIDVVLKGSRRQGERVFEELQRRHRARAPQLVMG